MIVARQEQLQIAIDLGLATEDHLGLDDGIAVPGELTLLLVEPPPELDLGGGVAARDQARVVDVEARGREPLARGADRFEQARLSDRGRAGEEHQIERLAGVRLREVPGAVRDAGDPDRARAKETHGGISR